ncbi:MAG: NAD(P)H-hydrate dehydratase [Gallionella sp.]
MKPQIITQSLVASYLTRRPKDSHKGMFGTVVVIGGASGMTGAALLAGRAALKTGAGCVHVGLLAEGSPAVDLVQPELMLHKAADALKLPHITVLAAGCGMGTSTAAHDLLHDALNNDIPLVLDADALNLLAIHPELPSRLIARSAATILTPHPGEAARLLCCNGAEIQNDRIAAVHQLAEKFGCPVVLKGANSLCSTRDGLFVNPTGNPGMSGPGMGDVLTGMIAAFIAQGLTADRALLLAVYLHGAAGDELAKQTAVGMTATELTEAARSLLNQWASERQSHKQTIETNN